MDVVVKMLYCTCIFPYYLMTFTLILRFERYDHTYKYRNENVIICQNDNDGIVYLYVYRCIQNLQVKTNGLKQYSCVICQRAGMADTICFEKPITIFIYHEYIIYAVSNRNYHWRRFGSCLLCIVQCGSVITRLIFSQIFTKDTTELAR